MVKYLYLRSDYMRFIDLITKKRNGEILSSEEIDFFIKGYTNNSIPDYQMSALLMAIYFYVIMTYNGPFQ